MHIHAVLLKRMQARDARLELVSKRVVAKPLPNGWLVFLQHANERPLLARQLLLLDPPWRVQHQHRVVVLGPMRLGAGARVHAGDGIVRAALGAAPTEAAAVRDHERGLWPVVPAAPDHLVAAGKLIQADLLQR